MENDNTVDDIIPQNNEPLLIPQSNEIEINPDNFLIAVKYANIAAGAFVSIIGLYFVVTFDIWKYDHWLISFYSMFLPFFYILFGLLLIAAEFLKNETTLYFRFLRSFLGRGLFNIFLATQCQLGWDTIGNIASWILVTLGSIYIFLFFIKGKVQEDVKTKLLD
ncbi:hypothetical protein pb186bvf_018741 [Paramecium bursaria]